MKRNITLALLLGITIGAGIENWRHKHDCDNVRADRDTYKSQLSDSLAAYDNLHAAYRISTGTNLINEQTIDHLLNTIRKLEGGGLRSMTIKGNYFEREPK